MRKIISRALSAVTSAIIVIFVILFVLWTAFGIQPRIVVSGSMESVIQTGSLCFLDTSYQYNDIKNGDIIAFETENGDMVTHRVIHITNDGMETKGDANDVSDGVTTTADNFQGKTLFSVPRLGYACVALQSKRGKIIGMTVIIALFILSLLLNSEEKKCERKEDR